MAAQLEFGHFASRWYGDQDGELHLNGTSLYHDQPATGITAHASGGQANAIPMTRTDWYQVTTVATAGDSLLLPPSYPGIERFVANEGANSCNVFPSTGDQINGAGANTAYAIAAGHSAVFRCVAAGDWRAISGT